MMDLVPSGPAPEATASDPRRRAQLAFLAQDDRLRESAGVAAGMSIAERLRAVESLCAHAAELLAALPPDVRERALAYREEIPESSVPVLRRLAGLDPQGPPWP